MNIVKATIAALGLSAMALPAVAQPVVNANNLVTVNIVDVIDELEVLAGGIEITIEDVQVPIGIAANVCADVTAAVIVEELQEGDFSCDATTATQALAQAAERQNQ